VGNLISKQKKKSVRAKRANPAIFNAPGGTDDPIAQLVYTRDNFVFPPSFVSGSDLFFKAESSNSNYTRVCEGLMNVTQHPSVSLRSELVSDDHFEMASIAVGKILWFESDASNSKALLEAWGISDEDDSPETILEKAGQKMFFNKTVPEQLQSYAEFIKTGTADAPKIVYPTHRVTYIVNRDPNVEAISHQQSLFITKIKRPNSKIEIDTYSPLKGKGVQIRTVKSAIELFPYV
jgi:hypothetical protein